MKKFHVLKTKPTKRETACCINIYKKPDQSLRPKEKKPFKIPCALATTTTTTTNNEDDDNGSHNQQR